MDYEKLIERLKKPCWGESAHLVDKERMEAATALSTLQSENKKLRAEMSQARESLDFARTKDAEILRLGMELGRLKKHMERLTHRLGNGEIVCNMARDDCRKMGGDCQIDSKVLNRLAAYEDTGFEPEEIELLAKQRDLYVDACGELPLKRIRELARADRDGLCGIPPVKLHQKIFRVFNGKVYEEIVCSATWEPFTPRPRWKVWVMGSGFPYYWNEVIGKTVFLTREETEAALRREQE